MDKKLWECLDYDFAALPTSGSSEPPPVSTGLFDTPLSATLYEIKKKLQQAIKDGYAEAPTTSMNPFVPVAELPEDSKINLHFQFAAQLKDKILFEFSAVSAGVDVCKIKEKPDEQKAKEKTGFAYRKGESAHVYHYIENGLVLCSKKHVTKSFITVSEEDGETITKFFTDYICQVCASART